MIRRSFKPAKCKTALKLAGSRMKLLKNKKEAQLKQLKKELAQLLQSGQDRTAMIRVEHVVREEKTLSAYELVEIYCELIVARLPIIESQKNCPIDLKEAIASVVFASPRCADVPELMDVRKQFTAKYGKEFTSAAVELRPDCGVGRMLIEKLSVKAPDGPTKIKILKSIAEEHDIKWDPSAENDPKPPEDLLNGPSAFEKDSHVYMDTPKAQTRPDYDGRGQSLFHVPSSHGNEVRHSYYGNGGDSSSGGQNWNMEFKDAAEAAQAAAESADRASMAARAAAELSGHVNVTRMDSPEGHGSYGLRADLPASSNFEDRHVAEDRVPQVQSEQISETEQDKPNQSSSLNPRASSFDDDDDHVVNSSQLAADMHSENNSSRPGRSDFAGQSSETGFESESEEQNDMKSENIDYPEQSSRTSSPAHSRTHSNDHDDDVLDPNNDAGQNPFAEENFHNDPLVFDESGSDDEQDVFDAVSSKGHESSLFFSSPGQNSPTHLSTNINAWSPRQSVSHPVFTEGSPVAASLSDNLLPVTFDDYNGPSYDSEEELEKSRHVRNMEVTTVSRHESPFVEEESESEKELLSQSFSNDVDSHEVHLHGNPGIESSSVLKESQVVSDDNSHSPHNHPEVEEEINPVLQPSRSSLARGEVKDTSQISDTIRDTEVTEESSVEIGSELSLGKLTGGFRNKGYIRPPYNRNASGNAFLTAQSSSSPRVKSTVGSGASGQESYYQNTSSRASHGGLDCDSEEETLQERSSRHTSIAGNQTSSSRSPPAGSGSDDSDSGENLPKHTSTSKPSIGIAVSRRTKATGLSGKQIATDHDAERVETSMEPHYEIKSSFHIGDLDWAKKVAEPIQDSNRPSQKERKAQEPVSKSLPESYRPSQKEWKAQEPISRPFPESNVPFLKERKVAEPVSKPFPESNRPSREEQPTNSPPKRAVAGTSGSVKTSSLSVSESHPKEKPGHVHPNLPDIDAITAHLQSLRNNP